MNRSVLLIILCMSLNIVNAQLSFTLGPKLGFTASKLSTDQNEMTEAFKANFQAGAFMRLSDHRIYLQPEVNFTTKGGLFSQDEILGLKEISLTTLEIPFIIGVRVLGDKTNNLRIVAAQTMAFVIDKNIRLGPDPAFPVFERNMIEDAVWGFQAGVGVDILMFTVDVRYEWGINNILNDTGISLKNRMVHISMGWKLF